MPTLTRQTEKGKKKTFKHIGTTLTENLRDKWASIPTMPVMTEEESNTLSMLEERLGIAKQAQIRRVDVWNASYLQYRSINYYSNLYGGYPSYWNEWGANIFIPRTFEVVEGVRAQLKSRSPDFAVKPLRMKWSKYAKKVHMLAKSEWNRSKSQGEAIEALDDAIIWGRGIVHTTLINDVRSEQTIGFDDKGQVTYTEEEVQKYYGVGSVRVDPYDFFPEPGPDFTQINSTPAGRNGLGWCFVRRIADVEDIRNEFKLLHDKGAYGVTDNYKYLTPSGDLTDYKYTRTYIDDLYKIREDLRYPGSLSDLYSSNRLSTSSESAMADGKIESWTYWEGDRRIDFACGMILRDTPNPYPHKQLPFSGMKLVDTKTFWSMGYPEIMRWLQIVDNTLYDNGLNNIVMNVHKMFAVNSRMIEDESELTVRPFGIVHMKQVPGASIKDAIQPIEFSPLFGDYFKFLQLNKQNIQTATGSSEFATGGVTEDAKIERATVANRIAQGGLMRVNEIARHFENELLTEAIEQGIKIMQLYYQEAIGDEDGIDVEDDSGEEIKYTRFIPTNREDIPEETLETFTPKEEDDGVLGYDGFMTLDEIQGNYRVIVKGGSSISLDPDDEANLKLKFADWARTIVDPDTAIGRDAKGNLIGAPVFDMKKLSKEVAKDVYKLSNPDDYMYEPPEQPQGGGLPEEEEEEGGGGAEITPE